MPTAPRRPSFTKKGSPRAPIAATKERGGCHGKGAAGGAIRLSYCRAADLWLSKIAEQLCLVREKKETRGGLPHASRESPRGC